MSGLHYRRQGNRPKGTTHRTVAAGTQSESRNLSIHRGESRELIKYREEHFHIRNRTCNVIRCQLGETDLF
jgi:hypothetical protein